MGVENSYKFKLKEDLAWPELLWRKLERGPCRGQGKAGYINNIYSVHVEGDIYEGEWANGMANGEGTFIHDCIYHDKLEAGA
jgi:hypothetical protein